MNDSYSVKVGDDFDFTLSKDTISSLDLIQTGDGAYHLLKDGRSYHVKVLDQHFNNGNYTISINGTNSNVRYRLLWMNSSKRWALLSMPEKT